MQINLTGFLESKTADFMLELWKLLLSAQESVGGIPAIFVEQKKAEMERKRAEDERVLAEVRRKEEAERAERGRGGDDRARDRYQGGRGPPPGKERGSRWDNGGGGSRGYGGGGGGRPPPPVFKDKRGNVTERAADSGWVRCFSHHPHFSPHSHGTCALDSSRILDRFEPTLRRCRFLLLLLLSIDLVDTFTLRCTHSREHVLKHRRGHRRQGSDPLFPLGVAARHLRLRAGAARRRIARPAYRRHLSAVVGLRLPTLAASRIGALTATVNAGESAAETTAEPAMMRDLVGTTMLMTNDLTAAARAITTMTKNGVGMIGPARVRSLVSIADCTTRMTKTGAHHRRVRVGPKRILVIAIGALAGMRKTNLGVGMRGMQRDLVSERVTPQRRLFAPWSRSRIKMAPNRRPSMKAPSRRASGPMRKTRARVSRSR